MATSPETSAGNLCESLAPAIWRRVVEDLQAIVDQRIELLSTDLERHYERPAGAGMIHISFRLGIATPLERLQGCLLLPLPDAITLAGYLMMVDDDVVETSRQAVDLDLTTKEAMLELCGFVAAAVDTVLRTSLPEGFAAEAQGCQGVRPDVRPALDYREGSELVVARARLRIHRYPTSEALLVLPAF